MAATLLITQSPCPGELTGADDKVCVISSIPDICCLFPDQGSIIFRRHLAFAQISSRFARVVSAIAAAPWHTWRVRRFLSHVAHRSGNKRHAAQLPDHDDFTAGSAVSHLTTGRSFNGGAERNGGIRLRDLGNRAGPWPCSQSGNSSRVSTFSRQPPSFAALHGLWDRPVGGAGASAKSSGVDEPLVAADGCRIALAGSWRCIGRQ